MKKCVKKKAGRRPVQFLRLSVASWNVRSLVESSGDARVCRKRPTMQIACLDRKLDLLALELERYNVAICGVQETKWFGKDVWQAGKWTFLHSGRPLPNDDGDSARRGEGVGLLMNEESTRAWRLAGEQWRAVSSRVMSARFNLSSARAGESLPAGYRRSRSSLFMTVVNVYAPTAKAPPSVKERFVLDLQTVLNDVPTSDVLVVVGDLNARVGVRAGGCDSALWPDVAGPFGLGQCNEAGEDLLLLCGAHRLAIMNTWFRKRFYGTWMHPATKEHHLIDYVLMRSDQRSCCHDVQVMRGATCWTDHCMVRAKIVLDVGHRKFYPKPSRPPRPFAVHCLKDDKVQEKFAERVSKLLHSDAAVGGSAGEGTTEGRWARLQECLCTAASEVIGHGRRKQPDWFKESESTLLPLLAARNVARKVLLQKGTPAARHHFRSSQNAVQEAVRNAKEKWIESLALRAESSSCTHGDRWRCIQQLQGVAAGRRCLRPMAVLDEHGNMTRDPADTCARWCRHFTGVLNICSAFDEAVLDSLPARPVMHCLDTPPTIYELHAALGKMQLGKAGGQSGILPEMLLHGGDDFHSALHQLLLDIWRDRSVVAAWRNAVVVPIPKKGDARVCDNWRGISLLDVAGKVFARILQDRLSTLAEDVLPDSQCGFRKGRGCIDMVFSARQLVEKSIEHDTPLYVLFVDLKKAYDSVPRAALWQVLQKLGVPPTMLDVIRSLHDGMIAKVRVNGDLTDDISVTNGLRQGCTLAPTLFTLYFSVVVNHWRAQCPEAGVSVLYKIGRRLVGDRTAKSRLSTVTATESQFADDAALYATTRANFEHMTAQFIACARQWGLTVSIQKTKGMAVGNHAIQTPVSVTPTDTIEIVDDFPYLGSIVSSSGSLATELTTRLAKASRAFGCLRAPIFTDRTLTIKTKRLVYTAVVLPTLLYGAETWPLKAEHIRRLNAFHHACLRTILGLSRLVQWKERLSSEAVGRLVGVDHDMADIVRKHRLRWLGHVARMNDDRLPKRLLFGELLATRPRHGPRKRWRDVVSSDLTVLDLTASSWYAAAQDRQSWRTLCQQKKDRIEEPRVACPACHRDFRRQSDLTRHAPFCKATT